jgi:hypothetical protein
VILSVRGRGVIEVRGVERYKEINGGRGEEREGGRYRVRGREDYIKVRERGRGI